MNYLLPERLDRLAREYALGTLAGRARRRFERLLRSSREASSAVEAWQRRLSVLELASRPVEAPESSWHGIERRLLGRASRTPSTPVASGGPRGAWWRLFPARGFAGALVGALLCAVLLRLQPGIIGMEPQVDAVPASYVGVLLDASGKAALVASSRRHGRQLTVKMLQPLEVPVGQVAQLWALPKEGTAPFPVGVVAAQGTTRLDLPDASDRLFSNVSQLAVTFEKEPSPTRGVPSAPYVLIGHCVKIW